MDKQNAQLNLECIESALHLAVKYRFRSSVELRPRVRDLLADRRMYRSIIKSEA
jgi:hypothetical protein